jgi:hypothetical protein
MLGNWGEGTTDAAQQEGDGVPASATDATWLKPFFAQAATWTTPGGDFSPLRSATTLVNTETTVANGFYTWTSPQLAYDVQSWMAAPAANFGWLLKADFESVLKTATGNSGQFTLTVSDTDDLAEGMPAFGTGVSPNAKIASGGINASSNIVTLTVPHSSAVSGTVFFAAPSAKRFVSRQGTVSASRPKLTVTYVPAPPAPSHRRAWELAGYFTGQYIDDTYDTDGDGIVDGLEYAWGFAPRTANQLASGFSVNTSTLAADGKVTLLFRRDPLAADLTYRCQVTSDFASWTTLATSTAGGVPTGAGFVSEAVVDASFRNVTVQDAVPPGTPKRFYRLHVARQ